MSTSQPSRGAATGSWNQPPEAPSGSSPLARLSSSSVPPVGSILVGSVTCPTPNGSSLERVGSDPTPDLRPASRPPGAPCAASTSALPARCQRDSRVGDRQGDRDGASE